MLVFKDGITRTIDSSQWQFYKEKGYQNAEQQEQQPSQQEIETIDEYTVRPIKKVTATKKKATKKGGK